MEEEGKQKADGRDIHDISAPYTKQAKKVGDCLCTFFDFQGTFWYLFPFHNFTDCLQQGN